MLIISRVSNEECEGHNNASMEDKCGRPLGLQFQKATGDLYIADAYGLLVVGKRGGVASKLASSANGVAFKFTNGIDIDQRTGMDYFTDNSSVFLNPNRDDSHVIFQSKPFISNPKDSNTCHLFYFI